MKPSNESNIIIYNTLDGRASVALYAHDGSVWMNQAQLAELFDTSIPNMSMHITNVLKENELHADSVIKNYLTTASDGKQYNVTFYSLEMILAVGFRVRSKRGTQFRIWANQHLREYLVKGFTMDDERLKNPNGRPDYFDELLERVREIRASEKRFYQKVRDLLALSSDYDSTDKATQMFFAETQNKLLYAVTGETAAELIVHRADASQPNMALTSWKGSVVRKQDIYTAKNYLQQGEIDTLNRLTTLFLDTAELRVRERKDLTLRYWRETVDGLLNFQGKVVLQGAGSVSNRQMEEYVNAIYEQFNARRKAFAAAEADREEQLELSAATDEDLAALQSSAERREKI
ncbi:MAG: virulence RhuM family protein [Paludibacteraceae bacterium]|nr:virulence RhuM family protein [Paludibacteraceae bacterium]